MWSGVTCVFRCHRYVQVCLLCVQVCLLVCVQVSSSKSAQHADWSDAVVTDDAAEQPGVDEVCHVVTPSHTVTHSPLDSRHTTWR